MSKTVETQIRDLAKAKVKVFITRKKRSSTGFTVIDPDGKGEHLPNRAAALQNLFARLRCSGEKSWDVVPGNAATS